MGRLIKWIFGLSFLLAIIIVAAVIVLPMVIDPNDHKQKIVDAVKEKTGRDLTITDNLKLTTFPWIGIEVGGVTLGNAEGFPENFAKINKLSVRVKVVPLFSRVVEIDTLVLDGLELNLQKNSDGSSNLDDLKGEVESADSHQESKKSDSDFALASLKVEGVQINNAQISWKDEQSGQNYLIKNVSLNTGVLSAGEAVSLEAGFTLNSAKPKLDVTLMLAAKLAANTDFTRYQIDDLNISVDGKGEGLPAEGMKVNFASNLILDLVKDVLTLTDINATGPEFALNGSVEVNKFQSTPLISGKLSLAETNLKQLAALFGSHIATSDPTAMTKVNADIVLNHDGKVLKLDPLTLGLDGSSINGYVHVLDTSLPVLRTQLNIDAIDVDRYLPPASTTPASDKSTVSDKTAPSGSFLALRKLDLKAEFTIGSLIVSKAKMTNVVVNMIAEEGVINIDPIKAKLYRGTLDGKTTLDVRSASPKIHQIQNLVGIQIGPLLKDLTGKEQLLGKGEVHVDIRTEGLGGVAARKNLNGTANFVFADGAYKGVNIAELIRGAGSRSTTSKDEGSQTDFSEMSGSVNIVNGVVTNPDLQAQSPLLRITGKGKVDLVSEEIDYLLTTELVSSLEGQGGKSSNELSGLPIPIKITGTFSELSYAPDFEALITAKGKQRIEQEKTKVKEKLKAKIDEKVKDKVGGALGDALKGFF